MITCTLATFYVPVTGLAREGEDMARTSGTRAGGSAGPSRLRVIVVEAEVADGDLSPITVQAMAKTATLKDTRKSSDGPAFRRPQRRKRKICR
jgi:hypothetical protein